MRIAYFISPHGFGHAARASAVMMALLKLNPALHFDIYTQVPTWFFEQTLAGRFTGHSLLTDIGLAQTSALTEDVPETVRRLDRMLPFNENLLRRLAGELRGQRCRAVLCDIAPMGIMAARSAGLPSVLLENFTWDWIYRGYLSRDGRLAWFIRYLAGVFAQANFHIQAEPFCDDTAPVNLRARPVARPPKTPPPKIRRALGIPADAAVVMVTMGGMQWDYADLASELAELPYYFIIPGGAKAVTVRDNIILLPHRSAFFHPDLIAAADALVGKVGYSTLAEVYYAGVPYGYVTRPYFQESQVIAAYVQQEMAGLPIKPDAFRAHQWVKRLPELLALPKIGRAGATGAQQVAQFIIEQVLPPHKKQGRDASHPHGLDSSPSPICGGGQGGGKRGSV